MANFGPFIVRNTFANLSIFPHKTETYFCKVQPLMPARMFKNVGYLATIGIATIASMIYYSLTVLWPTIIGSIYTTDSIKIGWQSSVVGGGVLLGQIMSGIAISYVPKVKIQVIIAACMVFAFMTALTSISAGRWEATIALGTLVCIGKFLPRPRCRPLALGHFES
jgi:hypothetical protein